VVHVGLGQHGVVWARVSFNLQSTHRSTAIRTLKLALAERRSVAGNDDQLGLPRPESLEGRLVTQGDLSRLHHQRQARVDVVGCRMVSKGHQCTREACNEPVFLVFLVGAIVAVIQGLD
jgi:hypothetical protein